MKKILSGILILVCAFRLRRIINILSKSKIPVEQRIENLLGLLTVDEKIGMMMDNSKAVPRLEIPGYGWWNEALHGVARAGTATVFPQAIGMAATWDARNISKLLK
jgi:beta-glucosidase